MRRICGHNIRNNWAFLALGHNSGIIGRYTGNKRMYSGRGCIPGVLGNCHKVVKCK